MALVPKSTKKMYCIERKGSALHPSFKRLGVKDIHLLRRVADDVLDHPIDFDFASDFLSDVRNILIVTHDGNLVTALLLP